MRVAPTGVRYVDTADVGNRARARRGRFSPGLSESSDQIAANSGVPCEAPRAYKWGRQTAFDTERAG
jgi:hypothetical protein